MSVSWVKWTLQHLTPKRRGAMVPQHAMSVTHCLGQSTEGFLLAGATASDYPMSCTNRHPHADNDIVTGETRQTEARA